MSSNLPSTNIQLSSPDTNLNDLYSTSPDLSHASSSSSSCLSNKTNPQSSINKINSNSSLSSNIRKESTLKLPYPVLSDHRDPSSILILLQKETQRTSKKMSDVIQQIEECEQRLTLTISIDNEKQKFKSERVKFKQQLDGLKKHERRVSLQIDFITTKSEIKNLEDEFHSDDSEQIQILVGKLKQKLDKMKIYMRTRNEQMKKLSQNKQRLNNSNDQRKLSSQKRSSTSANNSHLNKRLKSTTPIVRLTSHESKKHSIQPPIVRFITKTTNSKINSASPASSSSTLSPPLIIATTSKKIQKSLQHNEIPLIDGEDELDLDLDMDELFNDDSYAERLKVEMNELTRQF